jgi:KaiC/GvpD/RAD55 family RecA-like ATPase
LIEHAAFTKASTGIVTLDEALKGGVPVPSDVLLLGDAGTGKSVFCQQFLSKQVNEEFVSTYFCVDHPPEDIKENMFSLGLNNHTGNLRFSDVFLGGKELSFDELMGIIKEGIMDSQRFVIDSISSIALHYGEKKAYNLIQKVHGWTRKINGVGIVNAVRGMHTSRFEIGLQQALRIVIILEMRKDGNFLRIIKTFRTSHIDRELGIRIDENGIKLI